MRQREYQLYIIYFHRYEIREMIQKIKILHGDTARLELVNVPQTTGKLLQKVEHNGSVVRVSTPMRQDTQTGKYNIFIFRIYCLSLNCIH